MDAIDTAGFLIPCRDIQQIKLFFDEGRYQEAKELSEKILERGDILPGHKIETLILLGNAKIRLGNVEESILDLEKAVKISEKLKAGSCQLEEEITMVVLASDHLIKNEENFRRRLETAVESAKIKKTIVTLGIKPTKPETGYGYIETEECYIGEPAKVKRFWEKPNLERAEKYVAEGNYLWNSGMFIFEVSTILEGFEEHLPKHYDTLNNIKELITKEDINEKLKEEFEKFEKISIDFGIIEKANNIEVIPVDFGWNDIGSYPALDEVFEKSETGTINRNGRIKEFNSQNNIVLGTGSKEIALLGIEDMVVVETENKILICKKNEAQNIKKII